MSPAPGTLTSFDAAGLPPAPTLTPVPQFPPDVPRGLARRFREAFTNPYDDWLAGPPYAQFDGAPNWPAGLGRGASGTTADRRAGKDLPQFWSELDLRGYRTMARWLWDTNPFMAGFGARLVDYHVGRGFRWQACRRGQAKQPYATASSPDTLLKRAQTVLDEWRDRAGWPLLAREGFRRLRRDGEVVHRLTPGRDGLAEHRFVNPEQVGSPTGEADGRGSFGVERGDDPDDRDAGGRPVRVYVRDHDGDGTEGRWENCDPLDPAARVLFFKTNTDSDVKRGLPDSFSVHESLDECRKLVRNMVVVACAQAAIAWLEKFPTATAEQVRSLIPTGAPRADVPAWANGVGESTYSEKVAAGTVLRTEGSREFVPGPASKAVSGYIEAEQAALRMACVRWGFPPYLTAKADDINFASSLTAGSPFAVAVAGGQAEWEAVERAVALKVLDLAAEAGLLTWDERRRLDVEVTAPTVITPDPGAETQRNKVLFDAKILDPYTWMQREGLDPAHVEANWIAWNRRNATQPGHPGEGGAMLPGEPPPAPEGGDDGGGSGSVAEAKPKHKRGDKWETNGQWYTLRNDGVTIPIPNPGAQAGAAAGGGGRKAAGATAGGGGKKPTGAGGGAPRGGGPGGGKPSAGQRQGARSKPDFVAAAAEVKRLLPNPAERARIAASGAGRTGRDLGSAADKKFEKALAVVTGFELSKTTNSPDDVHGRVVLAGGEDCRVLIDGKMVASKDQDYSLDGRAVHLKLVAAAAEPNTVVCLVAANYSPSAKPEERGVFIHFGVPSTLTLKGGENPGAGRFRLLTGDELTALSEGKPEMAEALHERLHERLRTVDLAKYKAVVQGQAEARHGKDAEAAGEMTEASIKLGASTDKAVESTARGFSKAPRGFKSKLSARLMDGASDAEKRKQSARLMDGASDAEKRKLAAKLLGIPVSKLPR